MTELTREQVEDAVCKLFDMACAGDRAECDTLIKEILDTDAALRAQLDTSMRRQERLAENVNKGLLDIRALRAELEDYKRRELVGYQAEQHFQLQRQVATLTAENERLRQERDELKEMVHKISEGQDAVKVLTQGMAFVLKLQQQLAASEAAFKWFDDGWQSNFLHERCDAPVFKDLYAAWLKNRPYKHGDGDGKFL